MLIPVNGCFHDPKVSLYSSSVMTLPKLYSLSSKTCSSKMPFPTSSAGNDVKFFDAVKADLDGCHGDASCHGRGYCALKDDGVKLHELLCWADVLVLSTPVYFKGFSSYIKTVIDRLYPYVAPKGREAISVKESYLIATAASPSKDIFGPMKEEFALVNEKCQFECAGCLCANGVAGLNAVEEKQLIDAKHF